MCPDYSIPIYHRLRPDFQKRKAYYDTCGNAIGRTCGERDLPSVLREMMERPVVGSGMQAWMSGADVLVGLGLEDEGEEDEVRVKREGS